MHTDYVCIQDAQATEQLVNWAQQVRSDEPSTFDALQRLARRIGAHLVDGRAEIGFWAPELVARAIPPDRIYLEIFTPLEEIAFDQRKQQVTFRYDRAPLVQDGEFLWGVIKGMRAGTRGSFGSFYQAAFEDAEGKRHTIPDVVAYSTPYGAFAPAEFYDVAQLQNSRADRAYYEGLQSASEREVVAFSPPINILQLHISTATAAGTIAGLANLYNTISQKLKNGDPLTLAEKNFVGYDAIQPLPIEPTIEYETGPHFWQRVDAEADRGGRLRIDLRRPDIINWGYDIVLSASSAVNPSLLATGRPDELVDLAVALHNFHPKPMMLIFDVVYGHNDNQALDLLSEQWFRGPNMYGQDVNQQHPVVRALMLEMQRRKVNFGADGVRVDGAQDFKTWDPVTQLLAHDDDYLLQMSLIEQEVCGVRYRPWMIFEDGRPWPREDWPVASTYREVIALQPDVFQWGPITFAHNTPALTGFWNERWWRIEEIFNHGSHWISGCANHDTVRRGTQIALNRPVNLRLGDQLTKILDRAYDNPAGTLLAYSAFPGVPMDFINALVHAPWGFIRNTDDRYGVKVASEEALFLWWQVTPDTYARDNVFVNMKAAGFPTLQAARVFMQRLAAEVELTEYDLVTIVQRLNTSLGMSLTIPALKAIARAYMHDLNRYCNVARYEHLLDPELTAFNLAVRQFRRERPWLMRDLTDREAYGRLVVDDATCFYASRMAPDGKEQLLFVANMQGNPTRIEPLSLPIDCVAHDGWTLALCAPGVRIPEDEHVYVCDNSQGVVLRRVHVSD